MSQDTYSKLHTKTWKQYLGCDPEFAWMRKLPEGGYAVYRYEQVEYEDSDMEFLFSGSIAFHARWRHAKSVYTQGQEALTVDELLHAPEEEYTTKPKYKRVLDCFIHSGATYSMQWASGADRFDTSTGVAVWYIDKEVVQRVANSLLAAQYVESEGQYAIQDADGNTLKSKDLIDLLPLAGAVSRTYNDEAVPVEPSADLLTKVCDALCSHDCQVLSDNWGWRSMCEAAISADGELLDESWTTTIHASRTRNKDTAYLTLLQYIDVGHWRDVQALDTSADLPWAASVREAVYEKTVAKLFLDEKSEICLAPEDIVSLGIIADTLPSFPGGCSASMRCTVVTETASVAEAELRMWIDNKRARALLCLEDKKMYLQEAWVNQLLLDYPDAVKDISDVLKPLLYTTK